MTGLGVREKSFLTKPEWMTIPWTYIPKSPMDRFLDIVAHFPDTLQQFSRFKGKAGLLASHADIVNARVLCSGLISQLLRWRKSEDIDLNSWYEPSTIAGTAYDERVPSLISKERRTVNRSVVELKMVYSSVQLAMYLELYQLTERANRVLVVEREQRLAHDPQSPPEDPPREIFDALAILGTAQAYADAIIQAVEYFVHPNMGVLAAHTVVFPLTVAMGFLKKSQDPKVDHVFEVVTRFTQQSGVPMADLVKEAMDLVPT